MMTNEELVAPTEEQPTQSGVPQEGATTNPAPSEVPATADTAPSVPVTAENAASDLDLFEAEMARLEQREVRTSSRQGENYKKLSKGDRLEATVIQVEAERIFVDLGTKSEGVIPLSELTDENVASAAEIVSVGDKIQVIVVRTDGGDGNPVVSKKRADFDEAWTRILDAFQSQETLTAQVVDRVKGGLLVDIGVRGFVPATHVGSGKLRNIEKYVGESLELKIIEVDRERKKVVLSNRAAEEEHRAEVKEKIFTDTNPGDILEGTVRRLTDYGAFVDLGGIDGLLHISEMSWMRIQHPKEVLKEGQDIKVMVLKLDKSIGKISLGLRQVMPDPWNLIRENYKIGQKIMATINRMVQAGAFVRLPEGAEAFLPVSEISQQRIQKPSDVLEDNQEVEATIIDLRPEERRMVLSLKGGASARDPQIGYGYSPTAPSDFDTDRNRNRGAGGGKKKRKGADFEGGGGSPRGGQSSGGGGGATIGERLGMLKGFHFRSDEDEAAEGTAEATAEDTAAEPTAAPEPAQAPAPAPAPEPTPEATPEPTEEKTEE